MKTRLAFIALMALSFIPFCASAQLDSHAPGLYAMVGEETALLSCTRGTIMGTGFGDGIMSISKAYYKGAKSSVATDTRTFLLVIDPKKGTFSPKKPFVRSITPVNMKFLPLIRNEESDRREYEIGVKVADGLLYEEEIGMKFDWEQITDNSFKITIPADLGPGEYAFSFCKTRLSAYDYFYYVFGFTIPIK